MLNFFVLPALICLLDLLTITTTTQPYKAIEHFLLDCGSSFNITYVQKWDGEHVIKCTSIILELNLSGSETVKKAWRAKKS